MTHDLTPVLARRRNGVLLHPTSLPNSPGNGELGPEAYRFVDFLAASGVTVWQTLPLGPTHADGSPYQCLSVHAGNPLLISLERLIERGWLVRSDVDVSQVNAWRRQQLAVAWQGFKARATPDERDALIAFRQQHAAWLEDFALYWALHQEQQGRSWCDWPPALRDRAPEALEAERVRLADALAQTVFEQWLFFTQWGALKQHANAQGVLLFGDMPIFVAHDSVDVWVQRDYFLLNEQGDAQVVAGVPPDYFSATGQRWGNPHYRWERLQAEGFQWWIQRMATQLDLFDLLRVDHFRGFEACWEIPAQSPSAVDGRWVAVPGDALLQALQQHFGALPLVAEDLGIITPPVEALRDKYGLPGMKILQFAFDGGAQNPYLNHNHTRNCVVYTGTHDNATLLGWCDALDDTARAQVLEYLGYPQEPLPWALIRHAQASVAQLSVIPLQDLLGLGAAHRMNEPGTACGNWQWRFAWDQVASELAPKLRQLNALYDRIP